ncbi:MAG TPA: PEP-CTERM sorting domain-containing protein [Rhizomicrobium sp.]|nr:PEP-CTERM sorting domain-containing protein [Rhizomicrobium sp.]
MKRFWLILAAFLGLAATAAPASADIVYTLSNGGSILPSPGNYGTVTVSQFAADTIRVKIDLLPTERLLSTGSHDGIVFSLSGSPDLTSITVASANAGLFTVQPFTTSPPKYSDSPFLGPFEYAISWNGNGASNATETSITFDLKFGSNMLLSPSLFQLTSGTYFAVDIGTGCSSETNNKGETKTSCAATGAVASDPPTKVPEPGTVSLSIAGLMGVAGLVMLQRRRKQAGA